MRKTKGTDLCQPPMKQCIRWSRATQVMEIQEGPEGLEADVSPAGRSGLQEWQGVGGDAFFPRLFEGGSRKTSPWATPISHPLSFAPSLRAVMLGPGLTPPPNVLPTRPIPHAHHVPAEVCSLMLTPDAPLAPCVTSKHPIFIKPRVSQPALEPQVLGGKAGICFS